LGGDAILEERDEGVQRVIALAPPVEDKILRGAHLSLGNLVQRHDLRDMDDGASQAALQRMVEEDRVEHVTRRRVEPERDVGEAEDDLALRQLFRYALDRLQRP